MEDVDEDEDEEEVVVLGDAGCAVMRAVAGSWAAASAAATAGRMEGMSSCRRHGLGGPGGRAVTAGLIWSAAAWGGRRGAAVFAFWACLGQGPAMREAVLVGVRGGRQFAWAAFRGQGGVGVGFPGCLQGACAGHWMG